MSITIEFSPEVQARLEQEAARAGKAPDEFARLAVEEKLATALAAQVQRNEQAIALLDQWLSEPADPAEEAGYPVQISPLSFREITIE